MENKTGKKKKSNPYLKLVILVLVLAALVIGYKLLSDANKKAAAGEAGSGARRPRGRYADHRRTA